MKNSWYDDSSAYRPPWDETAPAKYSFMFTPGFRVTNIDGCNLMLRHDDAKRISKSKVEDYTSRVVADVWVQLNRMSPNKGRTTYRYTRNPEKARLLGAWRSDYGYRGWSSNTIVGLTLSSAEWTEPQRWEGMNLAFIFDTKQMSEQFDAAFRRAIKLCNSK